MEISAVTIYLINLCDNLRTIAVICAILSVIGMVMLSITERDFDFVWVKRVGVGFAVSLFFFAVLPSQRTLAAMIVIPAITNNEQLQKISKNVLLWAENYIHEHLEEQKWRDAK